MKSHATLSAKRRGQNVRLWAILAIVGITAGCDEDYSYLAGLANAEVTVINGTSEGVDVFHFYTPWEDDHLDDEKWTTFHLLPGEIRTVYVSRTREYIVVEWSGFQKTYVVENECVIEVLEEDFMTGEPDPLGPGYASSL